MKKGFTLIELMVVIVIIGILAALAIPRFLGATDRAKLAEWKTMAKELVTLQVSYRMLHNNYWMPGVTTWWAFNPATNAITAPAGQEQLGFAHPGGDSRFSYGTNPPATPAGAAGVDPSLGGARLEVQIGQFNVGAVGWMNSEGSVMTGHPLQ